MEVASSAADLVKEPATPRIEADSMESQVTSNEKPERDELRISSQREGLVNLALAMQKSSTRFAVRLQWMRNRTISLGRICVRWVKDISICACF
jgi:hypothetical protein